MTPSASAVYPSTKARRVGSMCRISRSVAAIESAMVPPTATTIACSTGICRMSAKRATGTALQNHKGGFVSINVGVEIGAGMDVPGDPQLPGNVGIDGVGQPSERVRQRKQKRNAERHRSRPHGRGTIDLDWRKRRHWPPD